MAVLNNNEVFLQGVKCFAKVFVATSQALVLGDLGVGFFLKAFKAGRLSIQDRGGVGCNSMDRSGDVFFHSGVLG